MDYALAKQLKDAGWKPKKAFIDEAYISDGKPLNIDTREPVEYPTLSELIEAVLHLTPHFVLDISVGKDLEKHVAEFWLELKKLP